MQITKILMMTASLALVHAAEAQEKPVAPVTFQIEQQSLAGALAAFAKQSGLQVIQRDEEVSTDGLTAPRLFGKLTMREALQQLLANTGLTYEFVNERTVRIRSLSAGKNHKKIVGNLAQTNAILLAQPGIEYAQIADVDGESETTDKNSEDKDRKDKRSKKDSAVEEMIVEKSKIKPFSDANADLPRSIDDHQPYYIFDSKEIERSGANSVQDFLRQRLTMDTTYETNAEIFPSISTSGQLGNTVDGQGIPGSNVSSFNLRGLGVNKTLILVNGRRMAGIGTSRAVSSDQQADLNGIPLSAIDRIEVLPSSASAIYGGSAIGGVINVVLKRDYQGGEVKFDYSAPSSSSSSTSRASATFGLSFEGGKSQLMTSVNYSTFDPMLMGDRGRFMESGLQYLARRYPDLRDASGAVVLSGIASTLLSSGGLGASMGPTGTFIYWFGNDNLTLKDGTVVARAPVPGLRIAYIAPGTTSATPMAQRFVSFGPELLTLSPGFGPWGRQQPLGTSTEEQFVYTSFTRQMNTWLDVFADMRIGRNAAKTGYGANPASEYVGSAANPFDSSITYARLLSTLPSSIPVESSSQNHSITAGFRAHFSNNWTGELSYTRSQNKFENSFQDYFRTLSWLSVDMFAGRVDGLVDPFAANLNLDPYSDINQPYMGRSRGDSVALRVAGPVFRLPWGSPTLSIGLDRHMSSMPGNQFVRYTLDGSPLAGFSPRLRDITTYYAKSTTSDAVYAEGHIPIVTDKNSIPLVQSLEVQLVQRMSRSQAQTGSFGTFVSYNSSGAVQSISYYGLRLADGFPVTRDASYSSHNETFALKYEPVGGVMLRASVGSAFLPPTYDQLVPDQTFNPSDTTITSDPVTGIPSYRANSITGGNPDLKPQRSETKDMGLIYQPRNNALKGLRANLQYYQISQFDFIGTPPLTELLELPEFANRVTRDPVTRQVTQVDLTLTNLAEHSSSGLDMSVSYHKPTVLGDFDFTLGGTKILSEKRQSTVTTPMRDYAGFPGRGGGAKYKANANIVWGRNHLMLGWSTNWYGSYRLNNSPGDPSGFSASSTAAWVLQGSYSVPSQMYHHVFASYDFGRDAKVKLLSGVGVQFNVQNVFNTIPPIDLMRSPFYLSPFGSYRLRDYVLSVKKAF